MIALLGDLSFIEILVIAALSVVIFGRNLPRAAAQAFSRFQRARRALRQVWRESGIGEEIRTLQRDIDRQAQALKRDNPKELVSSAMRDVDAEVRSPYESADGSEFTDEEVGADQEPDSEASDEPAGEAERRPPWYPEPAEPAEPAEPSEQLPTEQETETD